MLRLGIDEGWYYDSDGDLAAPKVITCGHRSLDVILAATHNFASSTIMPLAVSRGSRRCLKRCNAGSTHCTLGLQSCQWPQWLQVYRDNALQVVLLLLGRSQWRARVSDASGDAVTTVRQTASVSPPSRSELTSNTAHCRVQMGCSSIGAIRVQVAVLSSRTARTIGPSCLCPSPGWHTSQR
jgi:hypothetical protein